MGFSFGRMEIVTQSYLENSIDLNGRNLHPQPLRRQRQLRASPRPGWSFGME
jgi:hypothetical protein